MSYSSKESSRFLPIIISPVLKASPGKNLTGNLRIIRDLVADIHSNIQQWNAIHLNGVSVLKIITSLKNDKAYPAELKNPCEDLEKICDESDKIVDNFKLITKQIKAISNLNESTNNLFTTWTIEKFEKIYEAYQREAMIKRKIFENVAHDHRNSWKMLHLAAWVHQTQIPDCININLESMLIESNLRQ